MGFTKEEERLLSKLSEGLLDGPVGGVSHYLSGYDYAYSGRYIKDGIPITFKEDFPKEIAVGDSTEKIPGDRHETRLESGDEKLRFLQRYGYLIKDKDAQAYCEKHFEVSDYYHTHSWHYEVTSDQNTGRQYWYIVYESE